MTAEELKWLKERKNIPIVKGDIIDFQFRNRREVMKVLDEFYEIKQVPAGYTILHQFKVVPQETNIILKVSGRQIYSTVKFITPVTPKVRQRETKFKQTMFKICKHRVDDLNKRL